MRYEFRGREHTTGSWVYGNLLIEEGDAGVEKQYFIVHPKKGTYIYDRCKVYPETVSMWTDYEDKIGTQIFEKDIVRDKKGKLFVIAWNRRRCGFVAKYVDHDDFEAFDEEFVFYHELEVAGNIHNNPGLFEVQK